MINPQWLELPMSRTNFHGPKDVRAIEVRLYFVTNILETNKVKELKYSIVFRLFLETKTQKRMKIGDSVY